MNYPNPNAEISWFDIDKFEENYNQRREFQTNYAWAIPTQEVIKSIVTFANNDVIYEIGAGKGYWAYFINKEGGNIKCFDNSDCISNYFINKETFYPVKFCTPIGVGEECKNANVLMFCWPEYDKNWAYEYLKTIKPSKLIYVGEEYGGCCANDNFFKFIDKNYKEVDFMKIPQWVGLHDYCFLYEKIN